MKRSRIKATSLLLALAAVGGCEESTPPPQLVIAGSYTAIRFVTTGTSGQTNHLQNGSSLNITLDPSGTTSGHLHRASPPFDADMAGTWSQEGDVVRFAQAADTFVRDMPFTILQLGANEVHLVGDMSFSGTRIELTLARNN